ncbi:unnamed protein product, partial [Gulo gulo]
PPGGEGAGGGGVPCRPGPRWVAERLSPPGSVHSLFCRSR